MSRRSPFPMSVAREIYEQVGDAMNIGFLDLTSESRATHIARARYLIMRLLRNEGASLPTIGRLMSLHHCTVLNGLAEHERLLDDEPAYALAALGVLQQRRAG